MPTSSPGLKIASVRGVPVYVARTWGLIAVLIIATFGPQVASARPEWGTGAYLIAAAYTVLLLISVLVHEVAHTLAALSRGYRVERIVADLWGGHTSYDAHEATPGHLAFIAAVGPLANFALGGLGQLLIHQMNLPEAPYLLAWAFTWSNTFVGIFNSLPGLPLDGGFIVDALVWKITGNRHQGMKAAGWCGRVVAVLVVAWGLWQVVSASGSTWSFVWMLLVASLLWRGASAAVTVGTNREVLSGISVASLLRPTLAVPARTPIALAPESGAGLVLTGPGGVPEAVVPPGAHVRVPLAQRGEVPLSAIAHALAPGALVEVSSPDADITEILPAFAQDPPPDVIVVVPAREATGHGSAASVALVSYADVERALQREAHRLHSSP